MLYVKKIIFIFIFYARGVQLDNRVNPRARGLSLQELRDFIWIFLYGGLTTLILKGHMLSWYHTQNLF